MLLLILLLVMNKKRGYTLVELMVAVGLFAVVMLLASGAYLLMISLNRQAQGIATGIDNLSFVLETMARDIRIGASYNCGGLGDCPNGGGNLYFKDIYNNQVSYQRSTSNAQCGSGTTGCIVKTVNSVSKTITDPSVNIDSLAFYVFGTEPGDRYQPHVTIILSGTVITDAGKSQSFRVETGATMRGTDI